MSEATMSINGKIYNMPYEVAEELILQNEKLEQIKERLDAAEDYISSAKAVNSIKLPSINKITNAAVTQAHDRCCFSYNYGI